MAAAGNESPSRRARGRLAGCFPGSAALAAQTPDGTLQGLLLVHHRPAPGGGVRLFPQELPQQGAMADDGAGSVFGG